MPLGALVVSASMPSAPVLLIVSFSRLVADARILKQIETFKDDYRVVTCGYGPAPDGVEQHVALPEEAVYWRYDRLQVVARRWNTAYWGNPAVQAALDALEGRAFDAILANDVDTAGLAIRLHPRRGVHLDLHEFGPLQNTELLRFRLFVAPFITWQLRTFAARADSTTTVCLSLAEKYREVFGFDTGVVTNASPYADLQPTEVQDRIRIVHAGAALANRRLEVLIDAMSGLEAHASIDLFLTPNDTGYLAALHESADARENVHVHPPVPYDELLAMLNRFDVGVHLLAPTNFNNRFALPNKFFDYVQARLALLIGPSPEMERLLRQGDLGLVTDDFTVESLRRAIASLSPEDVRRWKDNSDAHAHELSAEAQTATWRAAIDRICGQ